MDFLYNSENIDHKSQNESLSKYRPASSTESTAVGSWVGGTDCCWSPVAVTEADTSAGEEGSAEWGLFVEAGKLKNGGGMLNLKNVEQILLQ